MDSPPNVAVNLHSRLLEFTINTNFTEIGDVDNFWGELREIRYGMFR